MNPFYVFGNNRIKIEPISLIFGAKNRKELLHQKIMNLCTSPVKCNYCTLRNLIVDEVIVACN